MNKDSQNIFKKPPFHHNQHRPDLVGEHPQGDMGQLFLLFTFLIVWGLDSFVLKYTTWLNFVVPDLLQIILGTLIGFLGGLMAWKTVGTIFGEKRDPPSVVSKGVYSFCRHPMYLAAILFYVSCLLFSLSLIAAIVVIGVIAFYSFISRYEEEKLLRFFGEEYASYMQKVPRWGIRLLKKTPRK